MTALPQERNYGYTYADLLTWNDKTRYELYDGQPVALASPTDIHQIILGELFLQIGSYLKGKKCRAYLSPFDVRLFEEPGDSFDDVDVVLQPDLLVVCNPGQVDRRGVHGAPDMVIEILSPTTAQYDKLWKFNLYQKAGVREYWIVDPDARMVSVYVLKDGTYYAAAYGEEAAIPVSVLEGCQVDMSVVFPEAPRDDEAETPSLPSVTV